MIKNLDKNGHIRHASKAFAQGIIFSVILIFCTGLIKIPTSNWKCPKCGYENLEGINKCGICGTPNSLMDLINKGK